jgi:putative membrane protein
MLRFIVRILGNALAIYLAAYFVPGFSFTNDWKLLLLAGFILAIFNAVLKPILKLISAPLMLLTLGLFSLVINMALLWLLTQFLPELKIADFWAYFWGTVIISLVNWIIAALTKKKPKTE